MATPNKATGSVKPENVNEVTHMLDSVKAALPADAKVLSFLIDQTLKHLKPHGSKVPVSQTQIPVQLNLPTQPRRPVNPAIKQEIHPNAPSAPSAHEGRSRMTTETTRAAAATAGTSDGAPTGTGGSPSLARTIIGGTKGRRYVPKDYDKPQPDLGKLCRRTHIYSWRDFTDDIRDRPYISVDAVRDKDQTSRLQLLKEKFMGGFYGAEAVVANSKYYYICFPYTEIGNDNARYAYENFKGKTLGNHFLDMTEHTYACEVGDESDYH